MRRRLPIATCVALHRIGSFSLGLAWRSIGGVGYDGIQVQENDTGPDEGNHAQHGTFVLAASNSPPRGEVEGAPSPGRLSRLARVG
jgi:hypothetical protein